MNALALIAVLASASESPRPPGVRSERAVELSETVRLEIPARARKVRVWVPRLPNEGSQETQLLEVRAPWPWKETKEPEYGNSLLYFEGLAEGKAEIVIRYRVRRAEQAPAPGPAPRPHDLKPRGLLVVNDDVRRIARAAAGTRSGPMAKARALYDYVLSTVSYDKTGEGWGRGDVLYVCRAGKGNCTDFHSLFMALAMAENIPARFRMGFSVPAPAAGRVEGAYHCWSEFFADGAWVPVDISEAWKNPARARYYFGRLDPDRVAVSTGREIRLNPSQRAGRLNFLSRPHAEADGRALKDLVLERTYKDLPL